MAKFQPNQNPIFKLIVEGDPVTDDTSHKPRDIYFLFAEGDLDKRRPL